MPLERVAYELDVPFESTDEMCRGNRWEALLQDPAMERPCFEDTITRGVKFNKWAAGTGVPPQLCETLAEKIDTDLFLATIAKHPDIVKGCTYQDHLEGDGVHCFLDFWNRQQKKIYEMKVVRDSQHFIKMIFNMNYDLQCYIQLMLAGFENEFFWLTIDSKAPHFPTLWRATPEVIESGRRKYLEVEVLFKRFNERDFGKLQTLDTNVPLWRLNQLC